MSQFEIRDLSFSYPGNTDKCSLRNINLRIHQGQYLVLCGKSGSGKTTLLRQLKTVLTPGGSRSGSVFFHNCPLEQVSQKEQAAKIGYVMQNPEDQIVTDKVWHELAFGLECLGTDPSTMRARVAEMACYFGIQDWFHRDVATLSGGQKQLLNLASVMAMQPEVLILDEPTSQLDPIAASDFLNTVRKINLELGTTVILTEHRLEDIFPYADRAIVMEDGKIIADDTPRRVAEALFRQNNPMFSAMPTPVRAFWGASGAGDCPLTVREGRTWLSNAFPNGVSVSALPSQTYPSDTTSALIIKDLWFRYERTKPDILRGVSAQIPTGSLFAIVGGNGAGKSTLLKAICNICRPYRGSISLFHKPLSSYKGDQLFRRGIAMLPQDPKSLFTEKTVARELLEMTADTDKVNEIAALCQIDSLLNCHPYDLSGGEQQRTALAKVLLTEPRLLLLDEPTKGIDSFFKEILASILCKLKQSGVTIIMVSHDIEFCGRYADLVSIFFDGKLLTTDTPQRFFGNNSFYTTAANRMSRHIYHQAVTTEDVIALCKKNNMEGPVAN